ncbi:MAG: ATP-binding protein [Tepidisphaeraceae bacterium]
MITLVVLQGPDKGRRFELPDRPALIGRDSRAIPLADNTVSRRHCELRPGEKGDWILQDLGSSNGTYVNGQRLDRLVTLKLGDQFRVGRTLLVFGAQPGIVRTTGSNVELAGEESGMDSSIINTMPSSDDSLVLAVPEPAVAAMANLKMLYRLSAALGSSFSLQQILEVVMDLVFEHVQADRGIILLRDEKHPEQIVPRVVRVREEHAPVRKPGTKPSAPIPLPPPAPVEPEKAQKIQASRTIINHVLTSGDGVLSSNAMADPRFSKGKSVHDMGIRSCLCAPIKVRRLDARIEVGAKGPDEVVGVIYIDSSVKNYTYSTDQLRLLTSIGLQAGLAIQNARLYQAGLEAERLAAIGETTAALSHSIKNILQALRGGADVVEMGLKASNLDQSRKGWGVVERNLEKIYNLTLNLLAYSKDREPSVQLVNPKNLIDECVELIANIANERGVMAVADVARDVPPVPMDPDGMHQVLMNLLSNAIDAMKQGQPGLVRVVCRYDAKEKQLLIDITDNGTGIEASMMRHLFELFHSTKGNRGTGLGLAVAKKIVEEHNGTISATSTPGQGTTITIKLPIYHIAAGDPSSTHGPPAR